MNPRQRKLLLVLWELRTVKQMPGVKQLVRISGISEMVIRKELDALEQAGWITSHLLAIVKLTPKAMDVVERADRIKAEIEDTGKSWRYDRPWSRQ